MAVADGSGSSELQEFTLAKMTRVLGADRARQILDSLLAELHMELRTPDDLVRLSEAMSGLGGFEGAVGAMLGVAAVLRGATPAGDLRSA